MIRKLLSSKRIISGLLAIILAVSTITVIKADILQPKQPLTVTIGNISAIQGDTVEFPVTINTPPTPIATYQMQFEFDKSKIEVTGVDPKHGSIASKCDDDKNGCFVSNIKNDEGWLKTVWVDTSGGSHPITSGETLFTVKFKIKSNLALNNIKFSVDTTQHENILFSDDQGKEITPVQVTGGTIEIPVADPSSTQTVPGVPNDGTKPETTTKEIGYIKVLKRINLWNRDQNGILQYSKVLTPGAVYKVYRFDHLFGGQYAVGGGAWITNMGSYVSYRSISEFGTNASVFPKGAKNEIGYVTITKPLNLWKRESNGELIAVRVLKKGETFRVYGIDQLHGGQYNLGDQHWVSQIWDHISFKSF